MDYAQIRLLHVSSALLSLAGFILRGIWMLRRSALLQHRLSRILPHINDTVLLASALTLAFQSGQTPWTMPWLSAKVIGLLIYIGLGVIALRRGPTQRIRCVAWVAAVIVFLWMLSVARLRTPLGFLSLLSST